MKIPMVVDEVTWIVFRGLVAGLGVGLVLAAGTGCGAAEPGLEGAGCWEAADGGCQLYEAQDGAAPAPNAVALPVHNPWDGLGGCDTCDLAGGHP